MAGINIRRAEKTDAKYIYELMQQQAREQNTVLPTHFTYEAMTEAGWGPAAMFLAFVAERLGASDGELDGFILAHRSYTTLEGRSIQIKEIYVVPAARRSGVTMHLCRELMQVALSMGCTVCDVNVDKANKAAVGLFEKLGGKNLTESHIFSMDSKAMTEMTASYESHGPPKVRPACPEDMASVMAMVQELAEYEKFPASNINAHTLVTDASPLGTFFECFVAECDGTAVGYVMLYHTFSCKGRGIWMEDIYVKETHRGQGIGLALMVQVGQRGLALGASHLDFSALSWNTPSIDFYQKRGATDLSASKGIQLYRFAYTVMKKCL